MQNTRQHAPRRGRRPCAVQRGSSRLRRRPIRKSAGKAAAGVDTIGLRFTQNRLRHPPRPPPTLYVSLHFRRPGPLCGPDQSGSEANAGAEQGVERVRRSTYSGKRDCMNVSRSPAEPVEAWHGFLYQWRKRERRARHGTYSGRRAPSLAFTVLAKPRNCCTCKQRMAACGNLVYVLIKVFIATRLYSSSNAHAPARRAICRIVDIVAVCPSLSPLCFLLLSFTFRNWDFSKGYGRKKVKNSSLSPGHALVANAAGDILRAQRGPCEVELLITDLMFRFTQVNVALILK